VTVSARSRDRFERGEAVLDRIEDPDVVGPARTGREIEDLYFCSAPLAL
jgi:hypothetical protein